jgi:hypothetical protein
VGNGEETSIPLGAINDSTLHLQQDKHHQWGDTYPFRCIIYVVGEDIVCDCVRDREWKTDTFLAYGTKSCNTHPPLLACSDLLQLQ